MSASGLNCVAALSYQPLMSVSAEPLMAAWPGWALAFQVMRENWMAGAISAAAVGSPCRRRVVTNERLRACGERADAAICRSFLTSLLLRPRVLAP